MSKFEIGFVILHYMNAEVTKECIKSIMEKVGTHSYKVVVIDNDSPNGSGKSLQNTYKDQDKVDIILNDKNDGFARGNNLGYTRLRNDCEYICILNNDVELLEEGFYQMVDSLYKEKCFAIMGPRIKMLDGRTCGLMPPISSYKQEKKKYHKKQMRYILAVLRLNSFREHVAALKNRKRAESIGQKSWRNPAELEHRNLILHGCCLIYSQEYISKNEYAFDPRTDFFGEEALLFLHTRKQNLQTLYTPSLTILHKESVSTKTSKTSYKKAVFQLGNTARSQKILLEELKSNA